MRHAINQTQGTEQEDKETEHYTLKPHDHKYTHAPHSLNSNPLIPPHTFAQFSCQVDAHNHYYRCTDVNVVVACISAHRSTRPLLLLRVIASLPTH